MGGVLFGQDYGVAHPKKCVPEEEVRRILSRASGEIQFLDTAISYGDSEKVIGRCLPKNHHFQIITKTSSFQGNKVSSNHRHSVRLDFDQSLRNLRQDGLYGLLVHHASDILSEGGEDIVSEIMKIKKAGDVEKIGVSAYCRDEVEKVMERFPLDIIQVPVSALDRRLLKDGWLQSMKERGVEVHGRSLFLQGVLLMDPVVLPPSLEGLKSGLNGFLSFCRQKGFTPLEGAVRFAVDSGVLDGAVFGVGRCSELEEILKAVQATEKTSTVWPDFPVMEENTLDPRTWTHGSPV